MRKDGKVVIMYSLKKLVRYHFLKSVILKCGHWLSRIRYFTYNITIHDYISFKQKAETKHKIITTSLCKLIIKVNKRSE
jgi:hypothetical protein